jgi:SpoIIAA-like
VATPTLLADARVRFVGEEEFDGWTLGAMWEDAKLDLKDPRACEKFAIVASGRWETLR